MKAKCPYCDHELEINTGKFVQECPCCNLPFYATVTINISPFVLHKKLVGKLTNIKEEEEKNDG